MSNATTRTIRVVRTFGGEITRASARDIRAALRTRGVELVITGSTPASDACEALFVAGLAYTLVDATALAPAVKGAYTRKANARRAAREARPASTGFMRAYLSARKENPALTRDEFAATFAAV